MAIEWHTDEGLQTLGNQWKRKRPGATVYYVGDASHASRDSDHNPEPTGSLPGQDYGEVDAADFMLAGSVTRADLQGLWDDLRAGRDPRIAYIIWNGQIVSSTVQPWVVRKYNGTDRHTDHLHLSVNDRYDNNQAKWKIGDDVARTLTYENDNIKMPILKNGDDDDVLPGFNLIVRAQTLANLLDGSTPDLDVDGVLGIRTLTKIKVALKMSSVPQQIDMGIWRALMGLEAA